MEIVPDKGSGQLKKRVLKFLERPDIKACYARIDKDSRNSGRLFVYFNHRKRTARKPCLTLLSRKQKLAASLTSGALVCKRYSH